MTSAPSHGQEPASGREAADEKEGQEEPWQDLERLWVHLKARAQGDPETSYTAGLLQGGAGAIGRKVVEESAEVLIAALSEGRNQVRDESADLLYHLLVLWIAQDIRPGDVISELQRRAGQSGLEEKAARKAKVRAKNDAQKT